MSENGTQPPTPKRRVSMERSKFSILRSLKFLNNKPFHIRVLFLPLVCLVIFGAGFFLWSLQAIDNRPKNIQKTFEDPTQTTTIWLFPREATSEEFIKISGTTTQSSERLTSRLRALLLQASVQNQCDSEVQWSEPTFHSNVVEQQIEILASVNFKKWHCTKLNSPQVVCKDTFIEFPFAIKQKEIQLVLPVTLCGS